MPCGIASFSGVGEGKLSGSNSPLYKMLQVGDSNTLRIG